MSVLDAPSSIQEARIEINYREPRVGQGEVGPQPDLDSLLLNGKWLPRFAPPHTETPGGNVRALFLDPEMGLLVKASLWGVQGYNEWNVWNSLNPGDEEFFQPIFAHQRIETPYEIKGVGTMEGYVDLVIVPYIKFDSMFRPDLELKLRDKADSLAAEYNILDWGERQYKPVNGGTSFVIHDYGVNSTDHWES